MENMKKCQQVLNRIKAGLELLTDENKDDGNKILKSFVLTNRAMLYQRLHFNYALNNFKERKNTEWPSPKSGLAYWYPFQIAFVRTLVGLMVMVPLVIHLRPQSIRTARPGLHR